MKFDEIRPGLPKCLCKYRVWKGVSKNILTNRELYLASPSLFLENDPMDCRIPVRFDLLKRREREEVLFKIFKQENPNANDSKLRLQVKQIARHPFSRDYCLKLNDLFFEMLDSQLGVLSLTSNDTNEEMWKKYADHHKGICVKFNQEILKYLGGFGDCKYYHDGKAPLILPNQTVQQQFFLQVFNKRRKYEFEEEYRTWSLLFKSKSDINRKIIIPLECFDSVIIGSNMPHNEVTEIKSIFERTFKSANVSLKRVVKDDEHKLRIELL